MSLLANFILMNAEDTTRLIPSVTTSLAFATTSPNYTTPVIFTSSPCTSVISGLPVSYPGLPTALSAPALVSPTPSPLPPAPVLRSAVPTPDWMLESGLSAEDEQVIFDHLGSSVRASTRKCYEGYWKRFKSFCEVRFIALFPSNRSISERFIIFIAESNAYVYGAKFVARSHVLLYG